LLSCDFGVFDCVLVSEEDRQWFVEAMQAHTLDSISRMKVISQIMKMPEQVLEAQGVTPDDLEGSLLRSNGDYSVMQKNHTDRFHKLISTFVLTGMLAELQEHVESIDLANGLILHN